MLRSCFGGVINWFSETQGLYYSIGRLCRKVNSDTMTNPDIKPAPLVDGGTVKLEKAVAELTEAIQTGKATQNTYLQRAMCFMNLSRYKNALEDTTTALSLGEESVQLAIIGGDAALNLAKIETSYAFYKIGLKVDPKNTEILQRLQILQELILNDYELEGGCDSDQGYSAVSLFSQEEYPGDEEYIRLEREALVAKFCLEDTTPWQENTKDAEKQRASNIALEAHHLMVDNQLEDALKEFTLAVKSDPGNAILRRLRSEVLYILDDKFGALREIWVVPKLKRSLDMWKFGGQILYEINMPLHAEQWLKIATTLSNNKDQASKILFQKARVHRLYSAMTKEFPVNIDFAEHGRSVFTVKDVKSGDELLTDLPLEMAMVLDRKSSDIKTCENCAASLLSSKDYFGEAMESMGEDLKSMIEEYWPQIPLVNCGHCDLVTYCSEECREDAWKSYHELLCPGRGDAAKALHELSLNGGYGKNTKGEITELWDAKTSPMLLARIWSGIVAAAKAMKKETGTDEPTKDHWLKAKTPYLRFLAFGGESPAERYKRVYNLLQENFNDCGDGIQYIISPGEFNGRFHQMECNMQVFTAPVTPYHRFKECISKLNDDKRVEQMTKLLKRNPEVAKFCGLFPLVACINHSCVPNIRICDADLDGYGGVKVIAKENIKKNEELFTSYIDPTMPRKLRRSWLFRFYNFWCHCKRCEFEGDGPEECTECKKKAHGDKFPACGQCHRAWYCTVSCQKVAWRRGHKAICQVMETAARDQ